MFSMSLTHGNKLYNKIM